MTSSAALVAGTECQSDATSKAIRLAAGQAAGYVMAGVAGVNLDAQVKLY